MTAASRRQRGHDTERIVADCLALAEVAVDPAHPPGPMDVVPATAYVEMCRGLRALQADLDDASRVVTARTWDVRLPWAKPPLSMNDRPRNWAAHARKVATVRSLAAREIEGAMGLGLGLDHVDVTLTYYPRSRRRADRINICATQKAVMDAVVDCGVVPDDTPRYVTDCLPVIAEPDGDPRLILTITEVLT